MSALIGRIAVLGFLALTACSDDDGGGDGSGGGAGGNGGTNNAGRGGGVGGTATGGGAGGTATAGTGAGGTSGAGGAGAQFDCTDVMDLMVGDFELEDGTFVADANAAYVAPIISPAIGLVDGDEVRVEFTDLRPEEPSYTGGDSGTFDLADEKDAVTCSRCVTATIDGRLAEWFQQSGTMVVAAGSDPVSGAVNATLTDIVLQPSAGIALQNDDCLGIASATVNVTP